MQRRMYYIEVGLLEGRRGDGATTRTGRKDIWSSFQSQGLEYIVIVIYNKGYQMIELFILL